jgi:hypothetical protein
MLEGLRQTVHSQGRIFGTSIADSTHETKEHVSVLVIAEFNNGCPNTVKVYVGPPDIVGEFHAKIRQYTASVGGEIYGDDPPAGGLNWT